MPIKLNDTYLGQGACRTEAAAFLPLLRDAEEKIRNKSGAGNDYVGWIDLPVDYDREEVARIKKTAAAIQAHSDIFVVIGIGGSYLGAKAAIDFLRSPNYNTIRKRTPDIYFIGNSFSGSEILEVISLCEGKDVSVNVVSKSGTTTESAIAFRVMLSYMQSRYSKDELRRRIFATTDAHTGALKQLADENGFETYVVPEDIGGRFSVLSAVGLLPIAVSGCDIDALMSGARKAQNDFMEPDLNKNDCYKYAALRNILYRKGKEVEVLRVAHRREHTAEVCGYRLHADDGKQQLIPNGSIQAVYNNKCERNKGKQRYIISDHHA